MKKLILSMMALAMLAVSCQMDSTSFDYKGWDGVAVTLGVGIPDLSDTRSGETGMNSGLGAIDNFSADEWGKYDLRYIVEIYEVIGGEVNTSGPVLKRRVKTLDEYSDHTFTIRLAPNRDYRAVVWADLVAENSEADLNYNTSDLRAITRLKAAVAMDECQDAYFIHKDIHVGNGKLSQDLILKRPFGKIRVITTDYDQVNNNLKPAMAEVTFYNHRLYTTLNAVTGVASGETVNEYTYTVAKSTPYTEGYDADDDKMTLFADYILAGDETAGSQEVNFTLNVYADDEGQNQIKSLDFNTQIPLSRNKLTTIMGNMLIEQNDFNISIDDNVDGETIIDID